MVKMILSAPHNFDAVKFMNLASELTRARLGNDYDLDLGDYIIPIRGGAYEIDGENVTFEQLDVIADLQQICPEVKIKIQHDGEDEDTCDELETFVKIANHHREELDRRESLDLFTDIVNAHHDAANA